MRPSRISGAGSPGGDVGSVAAMIQIDAVVRYVVVVHRSERRYFRPVEAATGSVLSLTVGYKPGIAMLYF
jgi:hypothetical protein